MNFNKVISISGRPGLLVLVIAWMAIIFIMPRIPSLAHLTPYLAGGAAAVIAGSLIIEQLLSFFITRRIKRHGVTAKARILNIDHTGAYERSTGSPYLRILLEVMPLGEAPFQAKTRSRTYSPLDLHKLQPGNILQVMYAPRNKKEVIIHSPEKDEPSQADVTASADSYVSSGTHANLSGGFHLDTLREME